VFETREPQQVGPVFEK